MMNNMINFGIGLLELLIVFMIINVIAKLFLKRTLVGRLLLECMKGIVALVRVTFRAIRHNLNTGIKYTKGFNHYIDKQCNGEKEKVEETKEDKNTKESKEIQNTKNKKVVNENICDNVINIKKKRKSINKV